METKKKKEEQTFEDSIKELETIVKNLENGSIPLDEAIDNFKKAMDLAKICNEKLKNAEDSINKILKENGDLEDFNIE